MKQNHLSLLVIFLALTLSACIRVSKPEDLPGSKKDAKPSIPIAADIIQYQRIPDYAKASGVVRAKEEAPILIYNTSGTITEIHIRVGSVVNKNQELMLINQMPSRGTSAYGTYRVISPISGIVSRIDAHLGDAVHPRKEVARIIKEGPLQADIRIPKRFLKNIQPGSPASFTITSKSAASQEISLNKKVYKGVVKSISTVIDPRAQDISLRISFPNPQYEELTPGTFGIFEIAAGEIERLTIPKRSLLIDGESSYVLIVDKEKRTVSRQDVISHPNEKAQGDRFAISQKKTGKSSPSSHIKAGAIVVTHGLTRILEGDKVRIETPMSVGANEARQIMDRVETQLSTTNQKN